MNEDERDESAGPPIDWAEQVAAAWRARMAGEEHTIVTRAGASLRDVIESARGISAPGMCSGFSRSLYLSGERRDRTIAVHAIFDERGGLASVSVRARLYEPASEVENDVLRAALEAYGGANYNSVSVSTGSEHAGAFEAIVYFGSILPFWATNLVDQPRIMSAHHRTTCRKLLGRLGVRCNTDGHVLQTARTQLRWPLSPDTLIEAYAYARSEGLHPAIYSTRLPVTQWARIEQGVERRSGHRVEFVDCAVGRGLSTKRCFRPEDLDDLDAFVQGQIDFASSGLVWTASVPGLPRPERVSAQVQTGSNQRTPSPRRRIPSAHRGGLRVVRGGKDADGVNYSERRE